MSTLPSPHPAADHRHVRLIQFDMLRATEMAALNCLQWIGKGNKAGADEAATDAIRGMFDAMDIQGEVLIGKGGMFTGERVGAWRDDTPRVDIAVDPLDGAGNVSRGLPNSISCIAAAIRHDQSTAELKQVPIPYMKKLTYPPAVRRAWIQDDTLPLDISAPLAEVIGLTAKILGKNVRDVVVMVLDRPRNEEIVEEVRSTGATLRMIADGDVAAALGPAMPKSGVDLYVGIGGAAEGVLSAVGLRCIGGGLQAQMWPQNAAEKKALVDCGWGDDPEKVYRSRDLIIGDDILFIATGISDSPLVPGVKVQGSTVVTQSVLMRLQSGTLRYVETEHDLTQRPLRLRSQGADGQTAGRSWAAPSPQVGGWRRAAAPAGSADFSGIVIFGPPGCGKGTIGKSLGRLPGFFHLSSGDVIRAAMSAKGARGERWAPVANGALISDADLWELFDEYLETEVRSKVPPGSSNLLIVDGVPRCRSQVSELAKRVNVRGIFYLEIEDQELLFDRLFRRSSVEARIDDSTNAVVQTRLRLFEEETLPILDEYSAYMIHRIDASQPPAAVMYDILARINQAKLTPVV